MADKCTRCNRTITNPTSVINGMGPVCWAKESREHRIQVRQRHQADLGEEFFRHGLVCQRLLDGRAAANVPHTVKLHSPTGFEFGYAGSGPADLALNTLLMLVPLAEAERLHQAFKAEFLAGMDELGGVVPLAEIRAWLEKNKQ